MLHSFWYRRIPTLRSLSVGVRWCTGLHAWNVVARYLIKHASCPCSFATAELRDTIILASPPSPSPPPPPPLQQTSELKGTTLKEVTQLASPPFHIQISTQRQMALVGDHAALRRRVDGSGWSRPVISTIWKCELKSRVMATFVLLFLSRVLAEGKSYVLRTCPSFTGSSISRSNYHVVLLTLKGNCGWKCRITKWYTVASCIGRPYFLTAW